MKYEFHAQYPFALHKSMAQAFALEWLAGKSDQLPHAWKDIEDLKDPFEKILILSQAIITEYKEQARTGSRKQSGGYKYWIENQSTDFLKKQSEIIKKVGIKFFRN